MRGRLKLAGVSNQIGKEVQVCPSINYTDDITSARVCKVHHILFHMHHRVRAEQPDTVIDIVEQNM